MTDLPHQRLDRAMNERRVRLKLRWSEVARRAGGMDPSNIRRIRRGEVQVTDFAAARLEEALEWESGTVAAILRGESPNSTRPRIEWDPLRDEYEEGMWAAGLRGKHPPDRVWEWIDLHREDVAKVEGKQGQPDCG